MSHLLEDIYYLYFDTLLEEMANMQPKETGLNVVVFVSGKGGALHGPRVKVSNIAGTFSKDNFTVTAESEPRVVGNVKIHPKHLQDVVDWVKLNKDHIHNVWHNSGIMDSSEISSGFKKL